MITETEKDVISVYVSAANEGIPFNPRVIPEYIIWKRLLVKFSIWK